MADGVVLSLFDRTGNMVRPWAKAGHTAIAVDIRHDGTSVESVGHGEIRYVEADLTTWLPPNTRYEFVAGFPPCDNIAVSGARWFPDKGMEGLWKAIRLFERARKIAEWSGATWMLENPVSVISSYWREPDYSFHPYEYDGVTEHDEAYAKRTCLWTSDDFTMPETAPADDYDERIHKMAPSEDRSSMRSETPVGFAKQVHVDNCGGCDRHYNVHKGEPNTDDRHYDVGVSTTGGGINTECLTASSAVVVSVYETMRNTNGPWARSDFAENVDVHVNTVKKNLSNLVDVGVLDKASERKYCRGPLATEIAGLPAPAPDRLQF